MKAKCLDGVIFLAIPYNTWPERVITIYYCNVWDGSFNKRENCKKLSLILKIVGWMSRSGGRTRPNWGLSFIELFLLKLQFQWVR